MQQSDTGYHYQLMRRAIDIIDQHDGAITLENLAREMGMSVAHFQRLFSNWVGVSPKKYQQYLAFKPCKNLTERALYPVRDSLSFWVVGDWAFA